MKNLLISIYRHMIPEIVRRKYSEAMRDRRIERANLRELEKCSFGDLNKDKTFYVIRVEQEQQWGLFSAYMAVVSSIKYALDHGWIPVVDFKNYYLPLMQDVENRGRENAWNYYFEDLVPEFPLEQVYQSKNVILGSPRGLPHGDVEWKFGMDLYGKEFDVYHDIVRKYMHIKPELMDEAERMYQEMFPAGQKVLGVAIRAGAYWGATLKRKVWENHTAGLNIEESITQIRIHLQRYGLQYFFLSCEDEYYVNRIKNEFGESCFYMERPRYHFFDENGNPRPENFQVAGGNYGREITNTDYLKETLLLTKCDSLFGTKMGASRAVFFLKDGRYEQAEVI